METLAGQGSAGSERPRRRVGEAPNRAREDASGAVREEEGRLSNPVQRRLSEHDVDELVGAYLDGSSIDSLAAELGVHRTTVMEHLERRSVERRRISRKMTDRSVRQASKYYAAGNSLKVVASQFGVDPATLAREFRRGGVPIRPRRGWPPA